MISTSADYDLVAEAFFRVIPLATGWTRLSKCLWFNVRTSEFFFDDEKKRLDEDEK